VFLRYFLAWIPTIILGIANAAIRQAVYARYVSELAAHQISTLSLCILYGIYVWVVVGFLKLQSPGQAISVGLLWMVLTILFEFGLGHYVLGDSWGKLLHAYNILEGRVWGLFILWVALAPYLFYKIKA
jgi:nitrate/nitrite-specific signal transduction histidine kinase